MLRTGVVCLVVLGFPAFGDPALQAHGDWRAAKAEARARRASSAAAVAKASSTTVDCSKGGSVQQAIDKNPGTLVIEVRGRCVENVRIDAHDVTLRGADPAVDGISSPSTTPAVTILNTNSAGLERLSLSDNPGAAVQIVGDSNVTMSNCVLSGNNAVSGPGGSALVVSRDSFLDATSLTFTGNRRGLAANRGSFVFCRGCEFSANAGFAATASGGGLVTLLNSTVSQAFGISANGDGSYVDIDCVSDPFPHPCSMQASANAARAFDSGEAVLYAAGDFAGRVMAPGGLVILYGARQTGASGANDVSYFGQLSAEASFDVDPPVQSRILSTNVSLFGRMLVTEQTQLDGTIHCERAGDAWLDPTVVPAPGSAVTGCEHGALP